MATAHNLPVSVSEYLHSSYRPDCDFVDGLIEERNLGELDHSQVQGALLAWFREHRKQWNCFAVPEIRIEITSTRYRVADVCVISNAAPREQIVRTPPLAVIEILSPEERWGRYQQRLADYREIGVKHVWVIDPALRKGFDCSTEDLIEKKDFVVAGTPIKLSLEALFADIGGE